MEISRQNYEQYFVDYLDGKLNEKQVGILMSFLEFNPDLKVELADIEKMCLAPDETKFSEKANLLKSETDLSKAAILKDFEMYCISRIENDIADEDEEILQGIIGDDPDREDTYMLYQSTRLMPDESITYPGKARLKKRFVPFPYRIIMPAAAAVAALLIVIQVFTGRDPEINNAAEIIQPPETSNDKREESFPPAETAQALSDIPSIIIEEKLIDNSPVPDRSNQEKGSHMAEGSIAEAVPTTSKASIQLTRIESKSIPQLSELNYLALKQTSRLTGYGDSEEISADNPKLSLWILADASVRGLNSMAEDEYHLDRKKDKNGRTRRITFDTPVFGISAPLRKPGNKQ